MVLGRLWGGPGGLEDGGAWGGPGGHRLGLGDDQHLGRRRNITHRISDESFEIFGSRRPDGIILLLESIFTKCNIPDLINNDTPSSPTYIHNPYFILVYHPFSILSYSSFSF